MREEAEDLHGMLRPDDVGVAAHDQRQCADAADRFGRKILELQRALDALVMKRLQLLRGVRSDAEVRVEYVCWAISSWVERLRLREGAATL